MSQRPENPVILAEVGAPHGIKGEVRIKTYTGDPLALGDYGVLYTSGGQTLTVKSVRPNKTVVVCRFDEIVDRNGAEAIKGQTLSIDRSLLPAPDEDEFYVTDLVGMDVVKDDMVIGRIADVPNFGAGDLLEVAPLDTPRRTWYLPFTREAVPEIDFEMRRVVIVMPESVEVEGEARD